MSCYRCVAAQVKIESTFWKRFIAFHIQALKPGALSTRGFIGFNMHRPTVGAQLLHQLDEYPAADQSLFEGHRGVTGGSQGGHRGVTGGSQGCRPAAGHPGVGALGLHHQFRQLVHLVRLLLYAVAQVEIVSKT